MDLGCFIDGDQPLSFPENARYPWRIAPYLANSFETIHCADNRAKLSELRQLDGTSYTYVVSVLLSLGVNSYFIGGNETEFPGVRANQKFDGSTVVLKLNEVRKPSGLMALYVCPFHFRQLRERLLPSHTALFDQSQAEHRPVNGACPGPMGLCCTPLRKPRVAQLDGHVEALNLREQQDMHRRSSRFHFAATR